MKPEDKKEQSEDTQAKSAPSELPPGVTEEPRNEEEMDLRGIESGKWISNYLGISDYGLRALIDTEAENDTEAANKEMRNGYPIASAERKEKIEYLVPIGKRLAEQINVAESLAAGATAKAKIRLGELLNHLKVLVEAECLHWDRWVAKMFGKNLSRSFQNYMRVAAVPGAIRYSVFGMERILSTLRQIDPIKGDDPIRDFLLENGIDFNPMEEFDPKELKKNTDIAIGMKKLANAGLSGIPREKVVALVEKGMEVEPKHIEQLKLIKATGGSVITYMNNIIDGVEQPPNDPEAKARDFKKSIDRFISKTKSALRDDDYLLKVDLKTCRELRFKIDELLTKLSGPSSKAA